jgi:hypothetical protein
MPVGVLTEPTLLNSLSFGKFACFPISVMKTLESVEALATFPVLILTLYTTSLGPGFLGFLYSFWKKK